MGYTKRPHKKTRTGCQTCRNRRVKCDELRPQCTSCSLRKLQCEYHLRMRSATNTPPPRNISRSHEQDGALLPGSGIYKLGMVVIDHAPPNPSPSPAFPSTNTKLHDMQLLHHYCTVTIETLGVNVPLKTSAIGVWKREVPQLAFEHEFLMDNLLAIASIHKDQLAPQSADFRLTALYQDRALRVFREAVSQLSKSNFLAVLVASTLLSLSALVFNRNADRLWSVDWLFIHTGVGTILQAVDWADVIESCIGPIFVVQMPNDASTLIPTVLQQMVASIEDDDPDASCRETLLESLNRLGELYGRMAQNGLNSAMAIDVMRWPFAIPNHFMELTKEHRPRALVILAHFIVLFELLPQLWWVSGVAKHEVETISSLLGPKWQSSLVVPLAAVHTKDTNRTLELLLSQLPVHDTECSVSLEPLYSDSPTDYVNPNDLELLPIYRNVFCT